MSDRHGGRAKAVAAAIVTLLLMQLTAGGEVTVLQNGSRPTDQYAGCQDTWISDNPYEGGDFSRQQTLTCGSKRNILIRFDLGVIPKDNIVHQAVLRLWDVGYPRKVKEQFPVTLECYRVTSEWKENASWREYSRSPAKEAATKPWKAVGGDLDFETDYGQPTKGLLSADVTIDGVYGHVHELDVTKAVQEWQAGKSPNWGLALIAPAKGGGCTLAASEWFVPSCRPALFVAHAPKGAAAAAVEPLKPAPKDVELDVVASAADEGKAGGEYAPVRVGQNSNCALRGASTDAYLKQAALKYPGAWGWMDMGRAGGRAGDFSHALVYFDLKGIPRDASIQSAKLHLSLTPFTNQQVEAYRYGAYLLRLPDSPGWKAQEVDLAVRKSGAPWLAGGVLAASSGKPVAVGKVIARSERNRRYAEAIEFDLTGAVRAWVTGKVPNCGLALDHRLEGGAYDFYSCRAFKPELRPYLEIVLSPAITTKAEAIPEVTTAPSGDYWVEPMRQVHKKFTGKPGLLALYGDSITYSMAFLGTAASGKEIPYKNMTPEVKAEMEAVWAHANRAHWQRRAPELGHLGQMMSNWFLANVDGWQKRMSPEACVILFGSNDLGGLCPPEYTENMAAGIRRILQDGTVPLLTTVPPASGRDAYGPHYYMACSIIAKEFKIPVVDYYGEIMRRRPEDWNGASPKFAEVAKKSVYEVLTPISGDGVHPSNPAQYKADFSEEALNCNGFVLRDYLTLRKYAEVITKVFKAQG